MATLPLGSVISQAYVPRSLSTLPTPPTSMVGVTSRRRSVVAMAAKKEPQQEEEKGFLGWLSDMLNRDHLLETDPVLNKVPTESSNGVPSARRTPSKDDSSKEEEKSGGLFGGLFGSSK